MASEVKTLTFNASGSTEVYFDLSSALTAANRRQYHQFTRKGVPFCYDITIQHVQGSVSGPGTQVEWQAAPTNWTVRNACVKMSAAWKHQLKEAGIRMRDLSKYGRRLRIALDEGMSNSANGNMQYVLDPKGALAAGDDEGDRVALFETYTTPDGTAVGYDSANEFTRVAIPDEAGAGDSFEMNLALMGHSDSVGANAYFGVVDEYLGSRGGVPDDPDSGKQTPDPLNMLQSMFSSTQPSTDEVIEAVEDYQDYRPYPDGELDGSASPPTTTELCNTLTVGGYTSANYAPDTSSGAAFSGVGDTVSFSAPLGLVKIKGVNNKDEFRIHVHAIYEM